MLKRNEGIIDRTVRVVLGIVLLPAGLFWLGGLQGSVLGLVVSGFSLLPLITGLSGVCPLYIPFGISTLEKEKEFMAKCMLMATGCRTGNQSAEQLCGPGSQSIAKPRDD
jgi:hypothetical protein